MSRMNKEGQYPLVLQVIRCRLKREIYTPYRLYKEELNVKKEIFCVKRRSRMRLDYIAEAREYAVGVRKQIEDICKRMDAGGRDYSVDDILAAYKCCNDYKNLFAFSAYLSSRLTGEGKEGTSSNYHRAVKSFAGFIDDPSFTVDRLTPQLLESYQAYLRQKGNKPNTVWYYLYQLRAVYRKAIAMNIIFPDTDPFAGIEMKKEKTSKRAIRPSQLRQVASADLSQVRDTVGVARDLFMFSFYTRGMSFVDMCYLRKENIRGDTLSYRRRKTGQLLEMKIEPELKELIDKYADPHSPYLLPMLRKDDSYRAYRLVQRKLNKNILKVGEQLGFSFPLTFYVARHTWATIARDAGVSISVISTSLGHTTEKTTSIYLADISHNILDEANNYVIKYWRNSDNEGKGGLLSYKRATVIPSTKLQ